MRSAVSPPRLPPQLTAMHLRTGLLGDDVVLERTSLTGAAHGVSARGVELQTTHLRDVDISGARLPLLALRDCQVTGGSLANVAVRGGVAERTSFEGVRLTGLSWHDGTVRDVTFNGCRIDLASFAGSRLERVRFEDCSLHGSDVMDARLAAAVFDGCDLRELDFGGARFGPGCELRGCVLDGARSVTALKGVRMSPDDVISAAVVFAAALGIDVTDEEDDVL